MCALHMQVGLASSVPGTRLGGRPMWSGSQKIVRAQKRLRLNRTWKVDLYLACEDSMCFLLLHFLLFSSCPPSFYCTLTLLLSLSQCRQPSAAFSTRLRKARTLRRQPRCSTRPSLSSTARLGIRYPRVSVHANVTHDYEFLCVHVSANWHSWVWQTRTYACTLRE